MVYLNLQFQLDMRKIGEIKCGVIFNPIMNEMFCAEKGNGSYLNNSRIRVSNKKKIKDAYCNWWP